MQDISEHEEKRDSAAAVVHSRPQAPPVPADMPSYMRPTVNSVTRVGRAAFKPPLQLGTVEGIFRQTRGPHMSVPRHKNPIRSMCNMCHHVRSSLCRGPLAAAALIQLLSSLHVRQCFCSEPQLQAAWPLGWEVGGVLCARQGVATSVAVRSPPAELAESGGHVARRDAAGRRRLPGAGTG